MTPDRTAAAIEARRRAAEQKLRQVRDAITELRRHKTPVTYPAVARRAGVSRTFLYENPAARALIGEAIGQAAGQREQALAEAGAQQEASWRERALNAEAALNAAHAEIRAQRDRIAVLMGQIRDLEHEWSREATQRITTENTTLKQPSASSPRTTRPWRNGCKPPAPTTGSPTGASPSSKLSSPSTPPPAETAVPDRPGHT